jgi:hypothetical protein
VVNCGNSALELTAVLGLGTKPDGTCTSMVPGRFRAGSGKASADVTGAESLYVEAMVVYCGGTLLRPAETLAIEEPPKGSDGLEKRVEGKTPPGGNELGTKTRVVVVASGLAVLRIVVLLK